MPNSALHTAASSGDINSISKLISTNKSIINLLDDNGDTALHVAITNQQLESVNTILSVILSFTKPSEFLDLKDHNGLTAIQLAIDINNKDIVNRLLLFKPDLTAKYGDGQSLISKAVANNNIDITKALLQHGANANDIYPDGHTLLHEAIQHNNRNLIALLIQHDANATQSTGHQRSALEIADEPTKQFINSCLSKKNRTNHYQSHLTDTRAAVQGGIQSLEQLINLLRQQGRTNILADILQQVSQLNIAVNELQQKNSLQEKTNCRLDSQIINLHENEQRTQQNQSTFGTHLQKTNEEFIQYKDQIKRNFEQIDSQLNELAKQTDEKINFFMDEIKCKQQACDNDLTTIKDNISEIRQTIKEKTTSLRNDLDMLSNQTNETHERLERSFSEKLQQLEIQQKNLEEQLKTQQQVSTSTVQSVSNLFNFLSLVIDTCNTKIETLQIKTDDFENQLNVINEQILANNQSSELTTKAILALGEKVVRSVEFFAKPDLNRPQFISADEGDLDNNRRKQSPGGILANRGSAIYESLPATNEVKIATIDTQKLEQRKSGPEL